MNRDKMLEELTALDFVAVDLALYLDTHPLDQEALSHYNSVVRQAGMLRNQYERAFGPLDSFRSPSRHPWQWIDNPWPWQMPFNIQLAGEEL